MALSGSRPRALARSGWGSPLRRRPSSPQPNADGDISAGWNPAVQVPAPSVPSAARTRAPSPIRFPDWPRRLADPLAGAASQDRHRGVVAADAADRAATAGAGAAYEHARMPRLHPPPADLVWFLREGPGQIAMEDVAAWEAEFGFQVDGCLRLEAGSAVRVVQQAVLDRLSENHVD